jgi:competence protein ComEA
MTAKRKLWIVMWLASILSFALWGAAEAGEMSSGASKDDQIKAGAMSGDKVDINRAGPDQLASLPGVGSKTAEKIMQYREKNGKFKALDDLKKVKGIGDKKFEKIKPYIKI